MTIKKWSDRVIQTPINKEKLEIILENKGNHEYKMRFCPYCGNNWMEYLKKIIFCPFVDSTIAKKFRDDFSKLLLLNY
jgi:hypothetical protein